MNRSKYLLMVKGDHLRLDVWEVRHNAAVTCPSPREGRIIDLIQAVHWYIRQEEAAGGHRANQWRDYVLGDGVGTMIEGIRTLLNGDIGRLDGGTLDKVLCSLAERIGYDLDLSKWVG